nr:hypothetical protein [Tanacetum cinerariifolium]
MATTIEQQVALDEALVPSTQRLRIGISNFRLPSDIQSKESTLQLVYDVLRRCPFFKAFLVTADVPEVYMQEFWAQPMEMLYICPSIPGQAFAELPFEEEILEFIWFLGHGATIRTLTDININKLYQPWKSFAAIINKCLTGKSSCYDSLRLSQAQILHQNTQQYGAMLPIELTNDEIRNTKAYKEYYACATGEAAPKPKASTRRNISGSDTSTTATTATTTPTTIVVVTLRLIAAAKGKQPAKAKNTDAQEKDRDDDKGDERDESDNGEKDDAEDKDGDERDDDDDDLEIAKTNAQDDAERGGDDDEESESDKKSDGEETRKEESFDPILRTPKDSEDNGNDEEDQGLKDGDEERLNEEEEADELYRDQESSPMSSQFVTSMLNPTSDAEMDLKKILIEKMEGNKSIQRSDEQRNLYKALEDGPSAGSDRGSKRRRECRSTTGSKSRQVSASESAFVEEPVQTISQMDEPLYPVFETGADDQTIVQSSQHPEWFSQPKKPLTPDRDWNKTLPCVQGSTQTWIGELAKQADSRSTFNELLDTPLDLSNFIMNRLRVDTLTLKLLVGPTFELMKGSCTSLIELEYHLEEVYKATTDQLDWVNPKGQQYPHNLLQPFSLIPDNRGRRVIPFAHFINNDLEYLRGGAFSRKYTTSITKTKAADYRNIKWIKDLVPRSMWIHEPINYNKHALWGVSYWGRKRQQFYGFAVNREFALDVYSKRRIIVVTDLKIVEWHSYKHLDWIAVRRDDDKLYKFKEGDFKRLRLQDIEDTLLLLVQGKLSNLTVEERFAFNVSLRMFTRSIVIQRRVEDLQMGVESYQKRLNLTKPDTYRSDLKRKEAYTAYSNPRGFIYQNKDKKNRLMRIDELHKFSDKTLNDVLNALDDRLKGIRMQYLPQTIWRKGDKDKVAAMIQAIDKMLKTRRIMRSLERFVGGTLYEGDFRMLQRTI